MQLKKDVPNTQPASGALPPTACRDRWRRLNLLAVLVAISALSCLGAADPATTNSSAATGVTDLRLWPDLRAVKLRWTYKEAEAEAASAFAISFCELTSWGVEIKCRRRLMRVAAEHGHPSGAQTVIQAPRERRHAHEELVRGLGRDEYEADVYELRALTNYTFSVELTREPLVGLSSRLSAGRRLEPSNEAGRELGERVQTKAFAATASKCLADVSEVLIDTGRYFGGRISVEHSGDPRCSLLGNRSSEQSSYVFRIEHELCGAKLLDGSRYETMVLVHENKDILTHNTARFLVLCNFQQDSYTLRASVSLPKVNALLAGSSSPSQARPAAIVALSRRPTHQDDQSVPVMLGSIPGVFLAARTGTQPAAAMRAAAEGKSASAELSRMAGADSESPAKFTGEQRAAELIHNNIIDTFADSRVSRLLRPVHKRQQSPRQVQDSADTDESSGVRSLALLTSEPAEPTRVNQRLPAAGGVPSPVDVQSKVLYVVRGDPKSASFPVASVISANAPVLERNKSNKPANEDSPAARAAPTLSARVAVLASSPIDARMLGADSTGSLDSAPVSVELADSRRPSVSLSIVDTEAGSDPPPNTMTNNHRVSSDLVPIAQLESGGARQSGSASSSGGNISSSGGHHYDSLDDSRLSSIKYSTARVDEYSVGAQLNLGRPQLHRARSGRMRSITTPADELMVSPTSHALGVAPPSGKSLAPLASEADQWSSAISRMGEVEAAGEQPSAQSQPSQPAQTLAQNITSHLLKWSLKTLSNMARKSLESMLEPEEGSLAPPDVLASSPRRIQPDQRAELPAPTTASTRRQISATTTRPPSSRPMSTDTQRHEHSKLLTDGFLTDKRRASDEPGESSVAPQAVVANGHRRSQHARPANYSKSIDLAKTDRSQSGPSSTARPPVAPQTGQPDVNTRLHQLRVEPPTSPPTHSADAHQQHHSTRDTSLLGWFLYSIVMVVGFASLIVVIVWLAFSPLQSARLSLARTGDRNHSIGAKLRARQNELDSSSSSSLSSSSSPQPPLLSAGCASSLVSAHADANYHKRALNRVNKPNDLANFAFHDTATKSNLSSISRASSLENDFKSNEFLCSEHVLINPMNGHGESFA